MSVIPLIHPTYAICEFVSLVDLTPKLVLKTLIKCTQGYLEQINNKPTVGRLFLYQWKRDILVYNHSVSLKVSCGDILVCFLSITPVGL